jgi:hypothetical protein
MSGLPSKARREKGVVTGLVTWAKGPSALGNAATALGGFPACPTVPSRLLQEAMADQKARIPRRWRRQESAQPRIQADIFGTYGNVAPPWTAFTSTTPGIALRAPAIWGLTL